MSGRIRSLFMVGLLLGDRRALVARLSARLQLAAVAVTTYHLAVVSDATVFGGAERVLDSSGCA